MPAKSTFETDVTYNNTTGQPLDSMATMGAFYEDNEFVRPQWIYQTDTDKSPFCGINSKVAPGHKVQSAHAAKGGVAAVLRPIFDVKKDGPLLIEPKTVKVETTAGNLTFVLEPRWAPKTATQIAHLFEKNAFDGTDIVSVQRGFLIQVGMAENKLAGKPPLPEPLQATIRRLPLEVDSQLSRLIYHRAGMLSMARKPDDPLDNTSSFIIMLGDAPHLNSKYTIFGKLCDDQETQETINKIIDAWPRHSGIIRTIPM